MLLNCISYLWIFGSYGLLDAWLRVITRWINRYSIYAVEPNLFTALWAALLTILVTMPKSRRAGRMSYCVTYFLFLLYAIVQYGAYLSLGNFLWTSDFLNAGEGADYASWVAGFISPAIIFQVLLLCIIGIVGVLLFPENTSRHIRIRASAMIVGIGGILLLPNLYNANPEDKGTFNDPELEYKRFSNANYDLELAGMYQYLVKDIANQVSRTFFRSTDKIEDIHAFFDTKPDHNKNEMTGIFEGKNLIVIQLESIDDWIVTEEDMPTTYQMMNAGMNFSNLYTPSYASGYTFNTEFAFNTGVYPYSNGNVTYSLVRNTFRYSLANMFLNAGYSADSYHAGPGTYYNRSEIHKALGYEQYHSYQDYPACEVPVSDDCFLTESEALFSDLTQNSPFFAFVITLSAHLPYSDDHELAQYALKKYPQYDVDSDREVNIMRAKARLTDDMLAQLLERLEDADLLENTVIAAYTDHYAYGLSDSDRLQQLSEKAGSPVWEKTPAFIYCAAYHTPITVDKVTQVTDLAPTLMNLFGMEVPKEVMGYDAFDENYPGFAIFPDNTWITENAYMKNGVTIWNHGMANDEIEQMNLYVQQVY